MSKMEATTWQTNFDTRISDLIARNKQLKADLAAKPWGLWKNQRTQAKRIAELEETVEKVMPLINKALLTVYDTVHPMPKVEISRLLSQIKDGLNKTPNKKAVDNENSD